MDLSGSMKKFYAKYIPGAKLNGSYLEGPCPFCKVKGTEQPGLIHVNFEDRSFFFGLFHCTGRCVPGGFHLHFGRLKGLDLRIVPGYDPDRQQYVRDFAYPAKNINSEIIKFSSMLNTDVRKYFYNFQVSDSCLDHLKIGFNGRYLVFPYYLEDGNCYAARCVLSNREEDSFWHGDETFSAKEFNIFNEQDIGRSENGSIFITEGEKNLLVLKELGYPCVSVPSASDLSVIPFERLAFVNHVFMVMNNSPESQISVRSFAANLGFKARIYNWPSSKPKGYGLCDLASDKKEKISSAMASIITESRSFSPFPSPEREHAKVFELLAKEKGRKLLGIETGFKKLDSALSGIRGINILGGPPKAGKSCFFMQLSTEIARKKIPVIYYDFENGRQKIYIRTLCRLSELPEKKLRIESLDPASEKNLKQAGAELKTMLSFFRIVTDRKIGSELMKKQIDFIQNETRTDQTLVVIDSLHKLPFKSLTERRSGIDGWLRNMEAIRDEQNVAFLVISELSREMEGKYTKTPDIASFKESGDIEYSADNAMLLLPDWDLTDSISGKDRKNSLWLVASRESSPGKIAEYTLKYPFWKFEES